MAVDELTETFAALADPTRRAILTRLADGEATVNELAEPFPITLQAVSKHLKVLERAGLHAWTLGAATARASTALRWPRRRIGSSGTTVLAGQLRPGERLRRRAEDAQMTQPSASDDSLRLGISVNRVFSAPRSRVWVSGPIPRPLRTGSAARGGEVPLSTVSMDVAPGGTWRLTMFTPERHEIHWWGVYREVVEPERLVFTISDRPEKVSVRADRRRAHRPRGRSHRDGLRAARPHGARGVRTRRIGLGVLLRPHRRPPRRSTPSGVVKSEVARGSARLASRPCRPLSSPAAPASSAPTSAKRCWSAASASSVSTISSSPRSRTSTICATSRSRSSTTT